VVDAITIAGTWLREHVPGEQLLSVGHRVIHGGENYAQPVRVDESVFAALEQLLYKESGLLASSGVSNDMRQLLQSPEPRALCWGSRLMWTPTSVAATVSRGRAVLLLPGWCQPMKKS
jgi:acetate kinase